MNAHDVRRLRTCIRCAKLGILDAQASDEWPTLLRLGDGEFAHPQCLNVPTLLALPRTELEHVRLCDVSMATMRKILERCS